MLTTDYGLGRWLLYRFEDMNFIKPNNAMSPDKRARPRTELAITKTHPHVSSRNSITLKTL